MTDAIYTPDGPAFRATPFAAGPWHPGLQHGGAPSALVAHAAEQVPTLAPMRIARVTVELLRPVPVDAIHAETEVLREGKKIQLVQVRLLHDGIEVVRAIVLRVRVADLPLPGGAAMPAVDSSPDDVAPDDTFRGPTPGVPNFGANFEIRRIRGGFGQLGPGQAWFRQHRATILDAPTSPVMRAMAVADFSNGIAPVLPFADWTFLNADLTVSLARPPEGEWIFTDAETWAGEDGQGLAMTRLADRRGYFARAVQSLLLERR
ncbi:acyl-CoA thioesterase [Sphingomonas sp. Leaf412]|uniref:thioesterase family protein n=1 Tax=Sphingomonas sp. Leaf412 TaxID=1736370 RepID=UPI0006F34609|nr:thioesterase family protein [Sphingomonas sp. Leaf412]KQT31268.1 acyl-CoA thioesterase [Sphingomonas sp. Leaf412]